MFCSIEGGVTNFQELKLDAIKSIASMSIQSVSSDIPPAAGWKYDVFLSFRGEDTRRNFTDHLYAALHRKGLYVFRDDKELERGEVISAGLLKAIEESRFSIIIFSRNYAYSTWCLDELVKIVKCKKRGQQMVFPIFYDVKPTVVRKQTSSFQEAFAKHEEAFGENIEKVQKWRDALKEVANIAGWELKDRNEVEFIEGIAKKISSKLIPIKFETHKELMGIESRVEELMLRLDIGFNDVRMIGICGMGGLGKTTIARVIYDLISREFEGRSFLANVREISEKANLVSLQRQLLAELLNLSICSIWNVYEGIEMIGTRLKHKKILLVIDDVVDGKQLECLAGKHDWFGSGSRIIITSRDKHLLMTHGVNEVHKLEGLDTNESLRLFCTKAFKAPQPWKEYEHLSKRIVEYAAGLPLALKVLGSFLFGRTIEEWESTLQRLKRDSTNEILDILQISFDGLKEIEKKIFLDIACFFKGNDRDYVTKILDYCGFDPVIGIRVLVDKCLISVDHNILSMHDLLQEMGQKIVKRQCPEEPGKWSRLWMKEDVHHVLTATTGTDVVEGIILNCSQYTVHSSASASSKAFSKMTNLRLLKISNVQLLERLEYLSKELVLLEWHGYPLKSLPSKSQLDKLVEINMCFSQLEQMWNGIKPLHKLKFMRLGHSKNLIRTPDFTMVPNLEELNLEGCTKLCEIHPSLFVHMKLFVLNLKDCTSLTSLPSKIVMESLRKLVLSGCSKLKKFPEIEGSMKHLLELFLDGTAIEELPISIERLTGLALLNLKNCSNLMRLPSTISSLTSLKSLILSGCIKPKNAIESLGPGESYAGLDLNGKSIRNPASSSFLMKNLKAIFFPGCKGSSSSASWYSWFPISLMPRRNVDYGLDRMASILSSLSGMSNLKKLDLSDCNIGEGTLPSDIYNLLSLEVLNLSRNNFVSLPGTVNRLSKLKSLNLRDCKRLESLPELPPCIRNVRVDCCDSLETLSDALRLCKLKFSLISGINCLKLLNNNDLAVSMIKEFLEAGSDPSRFSIVVPGSKIPEWFRIQQDGSSLKIRPSELYKKNNKLVGYVICCHFHVGSLGSHDRHFHFRSSHRPGGHVLNHTMEVERVESLNFTMEVERVESFTTSIKLKGKFGEFLSDHLWVFYLPCREYLHEEFWNDYDNHTEFSFGHRRDAGLEVKRCGFHPVYGREVEELDQNTVSNFDEFDQDFTAESTMAVATASKRSFTEYAGAEDSERSSCYDDFEETKRKRLKNADSLVDPAGEAAVEDWDSTMGVNTARLDKE